MGGLAQAVECLPSKPEVLSSNTVPSKERKKKKRKENASAVQF
jgi:uncharacterized protein YaiL (DUF2058 family)